MIIIEIVFDKLSTNSLPVQGGFHYFSFVYFNLNFSVTFFVSFSLLIIFVPVPKLIIFLSAFPY